MCGPHVTGMRIVLKPRPLMVSIISFVVRGLPQEVSVSSPLPSKASREFPRFHPVFISATNSAGVRSLISPSPDAALSDAASAASSVSSAPASSSEASSSTVSSAASSEISSAASSAGASSSAASSTDSSAGASSAGASSAGASCAGAAGAAGAAGTAQPASSAADMSTARVSFRCFRFIGVFSFLQCMSCADPAGSCCRRDRPGLCYCASSNSDRCCLPEKRAR